jgi:hypothetical protein
MLVNTHAGAQAKPTRNCTRLSVCLDAATLSWARMHRAGNLARTRSCHEPRTMIPCARSDVRTPNLADAGRRWRWASWKGSPCTFSNFEFDMACVHLDTRIFSCGMESRTRKTAPSARAPLFASRPVAWSSRGWTRLRRGKRGQMLCAYPPEVERARRRICGGVAQACQRTIRPGVGELGRLVVGASWNAVSAGLQTPRRHVPALQKHGTLGPGLTVP